MGTGGGAAGGAPREGTGPPSLCRMAARLSFFAEKIAASFPGWACTGSAALGLHPHAGSDRPPPLRPRQPREASLVASGMEGRGWGCVLAQGRGLAEGFQVGLGGAGVRVAGALSRQLSSLTGRRDPSSAPGTAMPCRQEPKALLKDAWLGKKKQHSGHHRQRGVSRGRNQE